MEKAFFVRNTKYHTVKYKNYFPRRICYMYGIKYIYLAIIVKWRKYMQLQVHIQADDSFLLPYKYSTHVKKCKISEIIQIKALSSSFRSNTGYLSVCFLANLSEKYTSKQLARLYMIWEEIFLVSHVQYFHGNDYVFFLFLFSKREMN